MKGTNFLCNTTMLFFRNIRFSEKINESSFTMINMPHNRYYRGFFFHLEFLIRFNVGSIDNTDHFELLFWNYIIFWIDHHFS